MMILLFVLAAIGMITGMAIMLIFDDFETFGMILVVASIVVMIVVAVFVAEDEKNACEGVGGDYVVIDTEYNVALKQVVDIYGCVK